MAKTNQTTELAVIPEQAKLDELIKASDIELTKAEAHVKAFHHSLAELGELSRPLADLDKENPTAGHALIARETRLKLVKVRTGAEAVKDDRKKILLIEGNFIQAAYNLVKGACELTEAEYMAIEKHQERIESERKSKLSASRKVLLEPFEVDTTYLPLTEMADYVFAQLLDDSKLLFETKKKQAEDAEKARIEAEKLEAERLAELARIEALRWKRADEIKPYYSFFKDDGSVKLGELSDDDYKKLLSDLVDEKDKTDAYIEAQRVENEKLKAEAERLQKQEIEKIKKLEANAENHIRKLIKNGFTVSGNDAFIDKQAHKYNKHNYSVSVGNLQNMTDEEVDEAIIRVDKWMADKAESDKLAAQLQAKKDAEELAHQKEKERIEAEESEKVASEKAPDVDKLRKLYRDIQAIQIPEFTSKEGKQIGSGFQEGLNILLAGIKVAAEKLKK